MAMRFVPTPLDGLFEVELEPSVDNRGYFARCWDADLAEQQGLVGGLSQWSLSFNQKEGTLRGLHWQAAPFEETKLVRCLQGAIWDVAVDMRPSSPTHRQWYSVRLDASGLKGFYIPAGFAHGFVTLEAESLIQYGIHGAYSPEHARGARWDDPSIGIAWPVAPTVIGERDATYADL